MAVALFPPNALQCLLSDLRFAVPQVLKFLAVTTLVAAAGCVRAAPQPSHEPVPVALVVFCKSL